MKHSQTRHNGILVKVFGLMAAALLALSSSAQELVDLTSPTGGTITYSSCLNTYEGTEAFDDGPLDSASRWLANISAFPNVYVQYQFNSGPMLVNAYRLTGLTSSNATTQPTSRPTGIKTSPNVTAARAYSGIVERELADQRITAMC